MQTPRTTYTVSGNVLTFSEAPPNGSPIEVTVLSATSTGGGGGGGATYTISAETATGGANLRLTGSDSSTDNVKFAQGSGISVTRSDANTITIASTGADILSPFLLMGA